LEDAESFESADREIAKKRSDLRIELLDIA
jgi:hypothetical protein